MRCDLLGIQQRAGQTWNLPPVLTNELRTHAPVHRVLNVSLEETAGVQGCMEKGHGTQTRWHRETFPEAQEPVDPTS